MSSKRTSDSAGIVTSDAVYHRHAGRKLLLGLLGFVLLAAVIAGTYYGAQKAGLVSVGPPGTSKKQGNTALSPAQAVADAQAKVSSAKTSTAKQAAYTTLGDAYRNNNQITQSTTAYQEALVYSPDDIQLLERLSGTYEDTGDKGNAITTLQKLITVLNASSIPEKDFLLSRYQAELAYVQGNH